MRALFFSSFLFLLPFFASAQTGTPCHVYQSGSAPPAGYAAAWNVLSSAREMLLTSACNGEAVTQKVGTGASNQYVYKGSYYFSQMDQVWKSYTLQGTFVQNSTDWLQGSGSAAATAQPHQLHWVGYICQWTGTEWKCGCRDAACATNLWQLQGVRGTGGATTGGTTGAPLQGANPNYTGGTSESISCVKRYRNVAWSAGTWGDSLVGKPVAKAQLPTWNVVTEYTPTSRFSFAKAPDGSVAMRLQFLTSGNDWWGGQVGAPISGVGLQTACLSYKMWLANGFWSKGLQNEHGHYSSVGKMPRLWGGPQPYRPACSLRSTSLANGAGFTAALTPTNFRAFSTYAYEYHDMASDNCGDGPRDAASVAPYTKVPEGRWVEFVNEVIMNSNGQKNGVQRFYLNGEHVLTQPGLMWEPTGKTWGVKGPYLLVSDERVRVSASTEVYYKDFVIYTND